MTVTREALVQLLEPTIRSLGFELADLELHLSKGRGLLRIFIDREAGISLEDCELISRQVSGLLDIADPISGAYSLEVSSPGLDRRLVKPAHFDRFMGSEVVVKLRRLIDRRRRVKGILLSRTQDTISVREGTLVHHFALQDVDTVRLVPHLQPPAKA